VIVVDDGSSDRTAEEVAENYPKVTILKGDGNLWWTGAIC
jgi:GT2 family glycosyltransferase